MAMNWDLARDIFWIELCHLLALIVSLYLNGILVSKAENIPLRNRYMAVQACLLLWIISKILKTISPTVELRWFFIVTQYLGVSFLGSFFFLFSFRTLYSRDPSKGVISFFLAGSSLCFIFVATNPLHNLFYSFYYFYRDLFGPLFYVTMGYQYSLIGLSLILLTRKIIFSRHAAIHERLIGLAALIPLAINIGYITDIINPMFDITPLAMTLSLGVFALAAFKYRFMGVVTMADRVIREGINDPFILFDRKGHILPYAAVCHPLFRNSSPSNRPGDTVVWDNKYYRLLGRESRRGHTLEHWADVTFIRQLETEKSRALEDLEKLALSIEEGNRRLLEQTGRDAARMAQLELHDILGHSLTQIILLLRSAVVLEKSGSPLSRQPLAKAAAACRQSLKEITLSQPGNEGNLISAGLYRLIENFAESSLHISICQQGRELPLTGPEYHTLLRCCQEAVTNSIKHGGADRVDIVLRHGKEEIFLLVCDNGRGCSHITPGMGLHGMEERISALRGTLRCQSEAGGGFMYVIRISTETQTARM